MVEDMCTKPVYRIAVFTGSRAEYGLLKNIMGMIASDSELELVTLVSGSHLEKKFGHTIDEIIQDGFKVDYEIPMNLSSDTTDAIIHSMATELDRLALVFKTENFDMLVVLGDRYELFPVCISALINRVPIAHIHGGEISLGAIDDSIRHSITKMAMLHFTATKEYRNRVIQMGEEPSRVFNVGAPGIENIDQVPLMNQKELSDKYDVVFDKPLIMVTFHPATAKEDNALLQFKNLLEVIESHDEYNYIFTYANSDVRGQGINSMIDEFCAGHSDCKSFKSMGHIGYLSMLRYAYLVLGNSSSGIIEVPSFGIPTVNIGVRQEGRLRADSVIDCKATTKEIEAAINLAASDEFRKKCTSTINPYSGNNTSKTIVDEIKNFLYTGKGVQKRFYDLGYEHH